MICIPILQIRKQNQGEIKHPIGDHIANKQQYWEYADPITSELTLLTNMPY